jgi:hypothetical protein
LALGTGRGAVNHDVVDTVWRESEAMGPRMSGWPARLAPAGGLDHGLGGPQGIGRGWERRVGRLAIRLGLEVVDLGLEGSDPLQRGLEQGP